MIMAVEGRNIQFSFLLFQINVEMTYTAELTFMSYLPPCTSICSQGIFILDYIFPFNFQVINRTNLLLQP